METYIVIDACTLINLLRIEENRFITDKLLSLNLKIASKVFEEINNRVFVNQIDVEQMDYIKSIIYLFRDYVKQDETLPECYLNDIQSFLNYNKKNGELYSTALSLFTSRNDFSKVYFYTDDFPAKEQFEEYFNYQQIGYIGDSVDLICFLYCIFDNEHFTKQQLKDYLQNLKSQYNPLKTIISELEKISTIIDKTQKVLKNKIIKVVDNFYDNNIDKIIKDIDDLSKVEQYSIKNIFQKYPTVNSNMLKGIPIIEKINDRLRKLDKFDLFKYSNPLC
ncbi:MAG: hypothetical protein PUC50_00205 [Bacteroidales bacterium]|nr:hypothetical protein [Bacteroidales bacterium]